MVYMLVVAMKECVTLDSVSVAPHKGSQHSVNEVCYTLLNTVCFICAGDTSDLCCHMQLSGTVLGWCNW